MDDALERRWTPHRMAYIKGENKPRDPHEASQCPFCRIPNGDDEAGLIVGRGAHVYVVLNLYPYNSGHLLVCPYRHVADYTDLDREELTEFSSHTQKAIQALRASLQPQGFNIGMNQGTVGGAGIAGHLHQHIVPRWGGDSNFMPVVARTKLLPATLPQTREVVAAAFAALPA